MKKHGATCNERLRSNGVLGHDRMGSSRTQGQSSAHSGKRAGGGLHCIEEGAIQEQGQHAVEILAENAVLL